MKKFAVLSLAVILSLGLISCGEETSENTDVATDAVSEVATNAANDVKAVDPAAVAETPSLPATTVEWYAEEHDFGKIDQGDVVEHEFKFKNTGSNPLKIDKVKPSCGCTTPDWSREEIAPGEEGHIKVAFDSKNKSGIQNKTVTVTLNTEEKTKLISFKGEVIAPETEPAN